MSPSKLPRGTVTFLFTDIERSTELARQLGAEFGSVRAEHRRILREAFAHHGGHEIDTAGDGFFVVFDRAADAVAAAVEGQRALSEPVRVRMGLHTAEPHLDEGGYYGVGVHRAARICAAGHGGQILLSNATAGVLEDIPLEGIELLDLGEHRLKDIERPQRVFQLTVEGLASQFPPLKTLDTVDGPAIVTLLGTDLVDWRHTVRALGDEEAAGAASAYRAIVLEAIRAHDGRAIEVTGDTALAAFERPRDALRAAVRIRDALRVEPWIASEHRHGVRIAVHSARVADPTAKHLGLAAIRLLKLGEAAEAWQILVSHATEALLEGELPDVRLHDLGELTLPDFEPARVYEVSA
jgi:class 3 adenylate cyclase